MKLDIQLFADEYTFLKDLYPGWKNSLADFRPYSKIYYKQNIEDDSTSYKVDFYGQIVDEYHRIMAPQYSFVSNIAGEQKTFSGTASAVGVTSYQLIYLGTHTKTLKHNPDGSYPNLVNFQNGGSSFVGEDAETNVFVSEVYQYQPLPIPLASILNNIERFNVESSITMSITKYLVDYYDKLVIKIGDIVVKTIENITNDYSLTFSSEELSSIYTIMTATNETDFKFILSTYSDSAFTTQIGTSSEKLGKGYITDANPIFSNFAYEDTNNTTIALTGDNQKIIKGYSNVKIIISNLNKAVAKKGATISKYIASIGEKQTSIDFSDTEEANGIILAVENNQFIVYAEDSRGNISSAIIKFPSEYITYSKLIIDSYSIDRQDNGISEKATLNFNGSWWNDTFGAISNSITCQSYYKNTDDSEWISSSLLTLITNENGFSYSGEIAGDLGANGFTLAENYDIKIQVYDSLSSSIKEFILQSGKPNIAVHKNGIAIGIPYDEELGGNLQLCSDGNIYVDGVLFIEHIEE